MPDEKIVSIPWDEFVSKVCLRQEILSFFEVLRKEAESRGLFLYVAGGPVRDFLLGREIMDVDLVLVGDWEIILDRVLSKLGGRLLMRSQFLTYKVQLGGETIDLATARKEYYSQPAVLPQVARAGLEDDIWRRDFTINALIYGLTSPYREKIVDKVGGIEDIKKGIIRPLHEKSFIDDPTRILRGLRYKVRFAFNFGEEFFRALRLAEEVSSPLSLSPTRLSQELVNFVKKEPFHLLYHLISELKMFEILKKFGLKERNFEEDDLIVLARARGELGEKEFQKLFLLSLVELNEQNLARLGFGNEERSQIEKYLKKIEEGLYYRDDILKTVETLERIPLFFLYRLLLEARFREMVREYLEKWRYVKPLIGGYDLKALGVTDGKRIGEILREIRRMKLLGKLNSPSEELDFAKNLIFFRN